MEKATIEMRSTAGGEWVAVGPVAGMHNSKRAFSHLALEACNQLLAIQGYLACQEPPPRRTLS